MRGPDESSSSEGGRDLREDIANVQLSRDSMKRAERGYSSEHLAQQQQHEDDQELDADLRSRALA